MKSSKDGVTAGHTATNVVHLPTWSDPELRQHTLLQQQKQQQQQQQKSGGIPITTAMMVQQEEDQRSIDSSTGAAYHVPIQSGGRIRTGRRGPASVMSSERLSVISDVKADIYDCDDDDDVHSQGGRIGQTEEEEEEECDRDRPISSSPHNKATKKPKKTKNIVGLSRKNKKQNRSNDTATAKEHSHPTTMEHSFWTTTNIRLTIFLVLLFLVVIVAIVVVVVWTKPNPNNDNTSPGNTTTPATTPHTTNGGGGNGAPPSLIYTADAIQYIDQVLRDITNQTYRHTTSNDTNRNDTASLWDDPTSSQVLARDWIIYQDSFLLSQQQQEQANTDSSSSSSSSGDGTAASTSNRWMERLLQRYALVQLYYATGGQYWVVNNQTNTMTTNVVDFANPMTSECTWTGVTCDDTKRRRYLQVLRNVHGNEYRVDATERHSDRDEFQHSQQQQHRLATAILSHEFGDDDPIRIGRMMQADTTNYYGTDGAMNKVFRLYFQGMNLTGTIPNELGRCVPKLYELDLSQNTLYGTVPFSLFIPSSFWDTSLYWLDLSGNNLRGSIPSNIWTLQELRFLFLNNNDFTGRIERYLNDTTTTATNNETNTQDDSISNDTNGTMNATMLGGKRSNLLKQIQLYDNTLTGSIPDWFQELSDLEQFIVFENELTGPLPDPVPASLIVFDVSFNQISGTIPIKLWSENDSPTKIERMYLDHNQLTGTIPNSTQLRQDMQRLWLNDNYGLIGTIPANFGQAWSRLSELQLHHTNVTGQLGPATLDGTTGACQSVWPNLTILKANCLQRSVTDIPPVYCECCTLCESVHGRKRRRQRQRR